MDLIRSCSLGLRGLFGDVIAGLCEGIRTIESRNAAPIRSVSVLRFRSMDGAGFYEVEAVGESDSHEK